MRKIVLILLLATLFVFQGCLDKYPGEPLNIQNNSEHWVYCWFGYWKVEGYTQFHYPDTILPSEKPIQIRIIAPHNSTGPGEFDPNWEKIFSELPAGKFSVYFFEKKPETQADWDSIRLNYDLVRKDVTYQEFIGNHYKIIYP